MQKFNATSTEDYFAPDLLKKKKYPTFGKLGISQLYIKMVRELKQKIIVQ